MTAARRVASCARRAVVGTACLLVAAHGVASGAWREAFVAGQLDPQRWQRTQEGDFRMQAAEVVSGESGYRLRLAADTRGTRDDTLKHVGVVSVCPLPIGPDTRLRVRLDWGPPANGSYLAGTVVLSPHATTGDPTTTPDYLALGYVGVPPGRNARLLVTARVRGELRTLFADGWPEANRAGRPVGQAQLEVAWRAAELEIRENGRVVHVARAAEAPFAAAYVYLQMTSHSNYAERAIHFDDVLVMEGDHVTAFRPLPAAPRCEVRR
jgi:hypothetical protein